MRPLFFARTAVLLFVILLLSQCRHDPSFVAEPDPGPNPNENPCDPDSVYFDNEVLPILQSSCALSGCHDPATAQEGIVLTSYESLLNSDVIVPGDPGDSELYEKITEGDPEKVMPPPPSAPLTPEQIEVIRKWISQGARNNACEGGACDSTAASFSQNIFPLIQDHCYGCHSGASPQAGVSLTSHASIAAVAASGRLLGAITHSPGYAAMPQNGNKLSDCQIAQVRKWITDGTPNN
ncbi:MAG TPA: hypothetical protein P5550_01510 [Bacteroidales bacterium]|nr:hypothetical protein [Bacteroidales bacterium]